MISLHCRKGTWTLYTILYCIWYQTTILAMSQILFTHFFSYVLIFSNAVNVSLRQRKPLSVKCAPMLDYWSYIGSPEMSREPHSQRQMKIGESIHRKFLHSTSPFFNTPFLFIAHGNLCLPVSCRQYVYCRQSVALSNVILSRRWWGIEGGLVWL